MPGNLDRLGAGPDAQCTAVAVAESWARLLDFVNLSEARVG